MVVGTVGCQRHGCVSCYKKWKRKNLISNFVPHRMLLFLHKSFSNTWYCLSSLKQSRVANNGHHLGNRIWTQFNLAHLFKIQTRLQQRRGGGNLEF